MAKAKAKAKEALGAEKEEKVREHRFGVMHVVEQVTTLTSVLTAKRYGPSV